MEWRVIPEFPQCEINNMGDVRRISDGFRPKLQRRQNIYVYSLQRKTGQTSKTVVSLMNSVYPELMGKEPNEA
jgi:hypothetical protein